ISALSYWKVEWLAKLFGANAETLPYVLEYMTILLLFSLVIAIEVCLSIFIRNDGAPQLAMVGLIISAILNIVLNYIAIFILDLGVTGAALATVIATAAGIVVYLFHFFK